MGPGKQFPLVLPHPSDFSEEGNKKTCHLKTENRHRQHAIRSWTYIYIEF